MPTPQRAPRQDIFKVKGLVSKHGRLYYQFEANGAPYSGKLEDGGGYALPDTYENRIEASVLIRQIRERIRTGEAPKKIQPLLYGAAASAYLKHLKARIAGGEIKSSTAQRYMDSLNAFEEWIESEETGPFYVHQIHSGELMDFKDWRYGDSREAVTVRHDLLAVSGLLQWCKIHKHVAANPFLTEKDEILIPAGSKIIDNVLLHADEELYFKLASKYPDVFDSGVLMLLCGLRTSEVRRLAVEGFNPTERTIQIFSGKTKAAVRKIYARSRAYAILLKRLEHAQKIGSPWLFPDSRNGSEHIGPLNKMHDKIRAIISEHKGKPWEFRLYDLRHTFATRSALSGMKSFTLAHILGHAETSVLRFYVHPKTEDGLKALKEIDERDRAEAAMLTAETNKLIGVAA